MHYSDIAVVLLKLFLQKSQFTNLTHPIASNEFKHFVMMTFITKVSWKRFLMRNKVSSDVHHEYHYYVVTKYLFHPNQLSYP